MYHGTRVANVRHVEHIARAFLADDAHAGSRTTTVAIDQPQLVIYLGKDVDERLCKIGRILLKLPLDLSRESICTVVANLAATMAVKEGKQARLRVRRADLVDNAVSWNTDTRTEVSFNYIAFLNLA